MRFAISYLGDKIISINRYFLFWTHSTSLPLLDAIQRLDADLGAHKYSIYICLHFAALCRPEIGPEWMDAQFRCRMSLWLC